MANASLFEFDISPMRVIKSWKLWNRSVLEGKMCWVRFLIQTRSHSVPVWKRWRILLEPAMLGTAVDTRSRLPQHFNPVYSHTWNKTKLVASDVWDLFGGQVSVFTPIHRIFKTFTLQQIHFISNWRNHEALQRPRKPFPASHFGSKESGRRSTHRTVHQLWR